MPIINRIAEFHDDLARWRHHLHQHPELLYDVHATAGFVAEKLAEFGVDEVVTGVGQTGVVGIIRGDDKGPVIGLRADMDALPIEEMTGKAYASKNTGKMHACGHDGHTTMLLGAARYLAETRNFAGTVAVIFQPAEEGGAGGKAMVDEGMMERFAIEEVYGMHNKPGLPVGEFALNDGAMMGSTDEFNITVKGHGGHAAWPHLTTDPVHTAAQIVVALQSIVSRNIDPIASAVVSVTSVRAGDAYNVIPPDAQIVGTIRSLREDVQQLLRRRCQEVAEGVGSAFGTTIEFNLRSGYPVTVNHPTQARFCGDIAADVSGRPGLDRNCLPALVGEDFSYMLLERPGAVIWVGNGDSAGLHNDRYDFNDEVLGYGTSYWAKLVERRLPRQNH